eukprot:GHVT01017385.1.p1 GENE.GHVT01017385.1~~GHVT01017385.1.p1  ORF type:complete len:114 (+),score=3.58 GHVT01017385.1:96-437(+)
MTSRPNATDKRIQPTFHTPNGLRHLPQRSFPASSSRPPARNYSHRGQISGPLEYLEKTFMRKRIIYATHTGFAATIHELVVSVTLTYATAADLITAVSAPLAIRKVKLRCMIS